MLSEGIKAAAYNLLSVRVYSGPSLISHLPSVDVKQNVLEFTASWASVLKIRLLVGWLVRQVGWVGGRLTHKLVG